MIILSCLKILIILYLIVVFSILAVFCINNYNVTITHLDTDEKEEITNLRKIKYYLFLAFLWPITFKIRG